MCCPLHQGSPTFLGLGTSFVEDNFSVDRGGGWGAMMVSGYYIQAHLLLCSPVSNMGALRLGTPALYPILTHPYKEHKGLLETEGSEQILKAHLQTLP